MGAEEEVNRLLQEAVRLRDAQDYSGALAACDRALALKPDYPKAWAKRGLALIDLEKYQEAVASFDEGLKHKPDDHWAWFWRGHALIKLKSYQKAVASFDDGLKHKPDDHWAWFGRGFVLNKLERYQEAIVSFDEALKHKPDYPEAWQWRKEALEELEKWVKQRLPPKPQVDLYEAVTKTEERLHLFLRQRLQQAFGKKESGWWAKGIPEQIRKECAERREEDPRRQPTYNYTDLIHLKAIVEKNWKLFEADFQRVSKEIKSKKDFLAGLVRLNEIRRAIMHPVRRAPAEEDKKFAQQMRKVIETFTAEMEG